MEKAREELNVKFFGSNKKTFIAAWLFSLFGGGLGIDRFYLGKIGTGILKLITIGGLGVWYLIDLILILANKMKTKDGQELIGYDQYKKVVVIATIVVLTISVIGSIAFFSDQTGNTYY